MIQKITKHIEDLRKKAAKSPLAKDLDSLKDMLEDLRI